MHELSIVTSVVETVTESLGAYPGARVVEVRLRVGALSAVIEDNLQFCFEIASEGTPLQGARLVVTMLPVVMHCEDVARMWSSRACRASGVRGATSRASI